MARLDPSVREALGRHVRQLRTTQQLTLATLAQRVGITPSALSQVETGKSEPTLGLLWRLGEELNASLFDFFASRESGAVEVTRANERATIDLGRLRYEVVAQAVQRHIDLFFMRLGPGEGAVREPSRHAGEEAGVVLSGAMDVLVAGERYRLGPGDGIWFRSGQPHTFAAAGEQECVSVWADTLADHGAVRDGNGAGLPGARGRAPGSRTKTASSAPAAARSSRRRPHPDSLSAARALPIDADYAMDVVERLSTIRSSPLGFRVTGTPEDAAVARLVATEMREMGLADVAIEPVAVDGWRFQDAALDLRAGRKQLRIQAASFGGVPATGARGVTGELVDGGDGRRRQLDRLDVRGRIVLIDWAREAIEPGAVGLELGLRGAAGMVLNSPAGGPYYQSDRALGSFNSAWHPQGPPMVTISREDAAALRDLMAARAVRGRLVLRAPLRRGASGRNVVGYLGSDASQAPVVVGAHHDGWFNGSLDDASGVAAMLALARALRQSGHQPRHRLCFTSRTAEEYGRVNSAFDWCTGAWEQINSTHREWASQAPFHLCIDATGHPSLPLQLEAPVELTAWARTVARTASGEGWLPNGFTLGPPNIGTEQWPLLVSGIPGVAAYSWHKSFARTEYHTQWDTPALVDPAQLTRQARTYALLLLEADRDPDAIHDHRARARDLARAVAELGEEGRELVQAAETRRHATGRAPFTAVGQGLYAVDNNGHAAYPHAQAAKDARLLHKAIAALREGRPGAAARALAGVGENRLAGHLSDEALAIHARRRRSSHPNASWGAASHVTESPVLGSELAALRAEPGARPVGPWLERSLVRALNRTEKDLRRRLREMTAVARRSETQPPPP